MIAAVPAVDGQNTAHGIRSSTLLDRTFGLRNLMCIAGAQDDIRIGPVLRIEERIATDRDCRIGLGDRGVTA
jgi:hypothetical protein